MGGGGGPFVVNRPVGGDRDQRLISERREEAHVVDLVPQRLGALDGREQPRHERGGGQIAWDDTDDVEARREQLLLRWRDADRALKRDEQPAPVRRVEENVRECDVYIIQSTCQPVGAMCAMMCATRCGVLIC